MAPPRRRERRRGRELGTGEHTQLQRSEKAQCSNHDATHTLILSHDGKVYEHWTKAPANCSKQRLVKELGSLNIVQIACGDQHAMALSRGGELFTWGQNAHGQLGVGSQTSFIPEAQLVERLKGIPLAQIAAGGAHSITVSLSGFVYSWGKNDCGQLGLGDTEVVIAYDTFSFLNRQHTLVYVPSLEKFYFFGSGDEGWPEDERKPNQLIPLPINPPVNTGNSCQKNNTSQKGIKITTEVNRSFVLCKENKNSYLNGIATLEDKKVDEWISSSNSKDRERIKKNIRLIFSSEACINGSFLEKRDKHFKTSKEVSGVDMSEVKHFYKKISKKPELFQEIALWKLSKYPCIFNTQNKITLHETERMILATERRCNVPSLTHTNILFTLVQRKWEFRVRRECFWQDIRNNLERASTQEFRKILWVAFVGEQGRDGGGPAQELFSIAARTICQPCTGTSAFCRFASGLVWFPSKASGCEDDDTFFFIGTLCGMALYNIRVMPLPFPRALYKKLLGLAPTLEDLEELLPTVGRNLRGILNEECDQTLEDMDIRFTIMEEGGSMDVVKLKENGANIPVTKDNRKEYVDLYVNYVLNESVQKPFQDFMRGFLRGCPARNWKIFLPVELQVVLQGHTTFDWHLLEKNVIYKQYNKSDQTIKDFWTVFHELSEEKKKMFLGRIHDLLKREKMLCWGYSSFGQPGIGSNLQVIIPEPQVYGFIHDRNVKEVACGGNHSVFLLEDGEVYTCGLNTKGQLGHDCEGSKPELIGALAGQHIVHVACGESHSVALSDQGQLFSWGAGSDGQLGLTTIEDVVTVPRLIKKLNQQTILQVSCGNWHCLALAADGQFFTWGQNNYGQLGLGKECPSQASPQRVKSLDGIPLAQVAAGGAHSFALSLSGAVFGWGKNSSGQLGLSDEQDRESPCHVKLLRSQKVVYISCGEEHTAVLTKSGGVFTFGAGSCGQLGHDSMNDEVNPRRVLELMGSEVSQIACGRHHTLAFVPSSGMIYAFGCGTRGQLGTGHTCNVKCPSPVKGHWAAHNGQLSGKPDACKYHIVKHIFSGGDQTFVLCSEYENSLPADDFRTINETRYTCLINDETIDVWRQKLLEKNSSNSVKIDEHFKTSPKIPGIDLNSTRVLFEKLMNSQHSILLDQILKSFESFLIPQLSSSPPDVEAMRIYLILPEFPPFQDSKYYISLTLPLAMAILRLDTNPSKVLDNWWSQVCPRYFLRLVDLYKGAVVYLLSGRKTLLIPVLFSSYITAALRLLEKLHKVNQKVKHVEYDKFYIPEISSLVDIQEDYLMWFLHQAGMAGIVNNVANDLKMLLCKRRQCGVLARGLNQASRDVGSIPGSSSNLLGDLGVFLYCHVVALWSLLLFHMVSALRVVFFGVLPKKSKAIYHAGYVHTEFLDSVAINGANLQNVFMLLTLEPLLARSPFLVLHVRRSNLVGDALRELSIHSDIDLKKPLKVIFDGEEAVDAGGVTKEFFLLLLKELLNPIYGMFTYYPESNLLWFSDTCFVEHNWFHLIGIVCGLAIYNFTVVDLHFPLALYKKLLNVKPCLEDLKELSPTEGRSLQQLLDYPGEDVEETFCLNFTICRESYGVTEQKNLIEDGDKILVQNDNREEFVEAYVNYIFNLSIHEWYTAFSTGFLKVCGGKVLELFQPTELRAMIVGNSNYNWEELEESAVYKGDYTATHPTVRMFWETFHAFPLEKKKKFLLFLTGSDRIPIYGMSSLRIIIQSTTSGEQYLPVAHTCYNLLDLPKYSSKEILRARLVQAIDHYEGFSLA
ncbi:hypothetical protein WISP_33232 [Willisornis vidua]|uniref:HECT domain-containing protein n=9 Tax=Neoaves TaxID=3078114 RepID=A0ABQ9DP05_9PASS|nr:hypothetical protein WISP_33232 [Willisornis vidua]